MKKLGWIHNTYILNPAQNRHQLTIIETHKNYEGFQASQAGTRLDLIPVEFRMLKLFVE